MYRSMMMAGAAAAVLTTGCAGPRGETVADKRDYVEHMVQTTMAEVEATEPQIAARAKSSPGYGIFSNVGVAWIFGGGAGGYGMVVDNRTGEKTYMRVMQGSLGLGVGLKEYKVVAIFNDPETLDEFVTEGWDLGGEATAAVRVAETGGEFDMRESIKPGIELYQFTDRGLYARAAVQLGKTYPDRRLNDRDAVAR